jgi:hypothetical protein
VTGLFQPTIPGSPRVRPAERSSQA